MRFWYMPNTEVGRIVHRLVARDPCSGAGAHYSDRHLHFGEEDARLVFTLRHA
jgi:hypothetical protein